MILYAIMPAADGGYLMFDYTQGAFRMSWQKIVVSLLQILAEQLGGWQGAGLLWLLEQLKKMGVLNVALPENIRFSTEGGVGAAPEEFKAAIKAFLQDLISKIHRPLIRLLLARTADLLTDAVLDQLWDRLVGSGAPMVGTDAEAAAFAAEFEAAA